MFAATFILAAILVTSQPVFLNANHDALYSDMWVQAATKFDHFVHPFKHQFIKQLDDISISDEITISPDCREGLQNFSSGLKNGRLRETMMFDSFSNVASGMMYSRGYNMGSYQQCLQHGRYVYLGIEFPVPKDPSVKEFAHDAQMIDNWMMFYSRSMGVRRIDGYHFGICSPETCKEEDLSEILHSNYMKNMMKPLSIRMYSSESRNDTATSTWRQRLAWTAILIIVLLGLGSALLNAIVPDSSLSQTLKPLDAFGNAVHLFSGYTVREDSENKTAESMFSNVNCFRLAYLNTSILGHTVVGLTAGSLLARSETSAAGGEAMSLWMTRLAVFVADNIPASLASNMILSACFTTYKSIEIMRKTKVNFFMYLLERILRLAPVMLGYILFTQSFPLIHFGGPTMQRVQKHNSDLCYQNGWKELLFVNNFAVFKDLCIPVAWFMSVDFQIYFFAFPLFLLIAKYPQHAYKFVTCVIAFGIMLSGHRFYWHPYIPIFPSKVRTVYDIVTYFLPEYYHTTHHVAVYGIGMLLGLKMLELNGQRQPFTLSRHFFARAAVCVVIVALCSWITKLILPSPSQLVEATLTRPIAATAFALMFYAMFNSESKWLQAATRSRFIVIASRISLAWYLTHSFHIMYVVASQQFIHTNLFLSLMDGIFILVTSFFSACLLHVFVEAPVGRLVSGMKRKLPQRNKSN